MGWIGRAAVNEPSLGPVPARMIADDSGFDVRKVGRALGDLVKAGSVTRTGSKRDSAYSLVS